MTMIKFKNTIHRLSGGLLAAALVSGLAVGGQAFAEDESNLARGGRLYDKWYEVIDAEEPKQSHPAYPANAPYADKPDSNWRCKECHGWDYLGKDGAYSSGEHFSGIAGISGAENRDPAEIVALLKAPAHGYAGKMSEQDFEDLALFVSRGQIDMDQYIDRASKKPKGDAEQGSAYFNTICANCHGVDGKLPKEMIPLGALMSDPWEMMHKVLNGQPGEAMPALRALDRQVVADIFAHMATLPKR